MAMATFYIVNIEALKLSEESAKRIKKIYNFKTLTHILNCKITIIWDSRY